VILRREKQPEKSNIWFWFTAPDFDLLPIPLELV
jgi:hypothetical protein